MECGNGNGDLLPLMVVYKAQNLSDNWTQSGPVDTKYVNNSSGWFNMNLFEICFFLILLPHVEGGFDMWCVVRDPNDTVVLLGGNLASNFSPKIMQNW